jgi:hypothetical protein
MTDKQWVALGVRIAGIILGLLSFSLFAKFLVYYDYELTRKNPEYLLYVVTMGLLFCLTVLMIIFPSTVAGRIIPEKINEASIVNESVSHIQASILSVAGVIILAIRLPDLMFWIVYVVQLNKLERIQGPTDPDIAAPIVTTFIEIAIALWLTFGSRGVVGMIRRFREAGLNK